MTADVAAIFILLLHLHKCHHMTGIVASQSACFDKYIQCQRSENSSNGENRVCYSTVWGFFRSQVRVLAPPPASHSNVGGEQTAVRGDTAPFSEDSDNPQRDHQNDTSFCAFLSRAWQQMLDRSEAHHSSHTRI